jgi:hypothetical protein
VGKVLYGDETVVRLKENFPFRFLILRKTRAIQFSFHLKSLSLQQRMNQESNGKRKAHSQARSDRKRKAASRVCPETMRAREVTTLRATSGFLITRPFIDVIRQIDLSPKFREYLSSLQQEEVSYSHQVEILHPGSNTIDKVLPIIR